jgi:hypothetical protein
MILAVPLTLPQQKDRYFGKHHTPSQCRCKNVLRLTKIRDRRAMPLAQREAFGIGFYTIHDRIQPVQKRHLQLL